MKLLAVVAFLLAVHAEPLTPEKALKSRGLSDLRYSPDGKRIAFTVREPAAGKLSQRHIWVYDSARAEIRQWTFSTKSEYEPRWSPDGRTLAFLSDREDTPQIWTMPIDGGEAEKLTSAKNSVQTFRWSPDGKRIAFIASDPKTDAEEKKAKEFDDAQVMDNGDKAPGLWTLDVAAKKVRRETDAKWHIRELDWMPDGKRMLVVATDRPFEDRHTNRIFLLSLESGVMEQVLAPKGPFGDVKVAPGGASFAFLGARFDGPSPHDLYVCPFDSRAPKNLTSISPDRPVDNFEWIDDSQLAVLFTNGFHTELNAIGRETRKLIQDDSVDPSSFTLSAQGSVGYVAGTAVRLSELFVDGHPVSHLNSAFDSIPLYKPEFIHYKSFDGMSIEAALYRPVADGQPGPLVVLVHGGPTGAWGNRYDALTQLLVAKGYTVLQPNIRGSVGYGHKFIEANRGDWGGGDFKDVMAGVDDLVNRKIADPNRLGICGWSYGGYMAEWAITQTDRFKAAVSGAGMADLATEFGTESGPVYDEWFFGTPYESLAGFQKSSPITYIKNAKTPTLILQGEDDTTDPLSQSQILHRGLKRYNVPVEFVVYPREPHGLREQNHLLDRDVRILAFVDKYILGTGQTRNLELTSPLGTKYYSLPDEKGVIAAAQKNVDADPKNPALLLKLAQAQASVWQDREAVATCTRALAMAPDNAEIYLERGHRELPLREFQNAKADLQKAAALDPKRMDAYYHLGLAHYFLGEFQEAADAFQHSFETAPNNDERINSTNWLYASLRRANKKSEAEAALTKITPEMKNDAAHTYFYLSLVRLFQGAMSEHDVVPPDPSGDDTEAELRFDTVAYGIGNWRLYNGERDKAQAYFQRIAKGNVWITWGFVGAETELARMQPATSPKPR
ncbi:MAG: prolyl oligopeptidase family serine peptidase [Bryobacteraceae bacterium]|jgi:dipeptidyl aminopeptidase/acylaminoacyl peptidase/Flp pilus assembly protein TadD